MQIAHTKIQTLIVLILTLNVTIFFVFNLLYFCYHVGEVAGGPRSESPLIDVEAVSDDDSEAKQSAVGQSLTKSIGTSLVKFISSLDSLD